VDKTGKTIKPKAKTHNSKIKKSVALVIVIIIVLTASVSLYYLLNNKKQSIQTSELTPAPSVITSINTSNNTIKTTLPSNNTLNQNVSILNNSSTLNASTPSEELNATQQVNQTVNQTVNYTELCLNNSVYVGNFNLATRNLNYSWAPYYGVFYVRVFVDYSDKLGKPFADVSEVLAFNGTDCSYTPVFQGQTVVLPACKFIMKVNSISLVGGVWVANVDISHC
jgi:hypothetical protein